MACCEADAVVAACDEDDGFRVGHFDDVFSQEKERSWISCQNNQIWICICKLLDKVNGGVSPPGGGTSSIIQSESSCPVASPEEHWL